MKRTSSFVAAAALAAAFAYAAGGPPLAGVWNIAPTGSASTSGDLVFRVTRADGSDPVEITVPVLMGARQETIARGIRSALSSQLGSDYRVQLGEGDNILVSDPRGKPNFSIELLDSDIDNLRVAVQSVTPAAAPTVPTQNVPAVPPPPAVPAPANQPGVPAPPPDNPMPPPNNAPVPSPGTPPPTGAPVPSPSMPVPNPSTPVPSPAMPVPNPSPPPNATGGAGQPASAPPPNATPASPPGTSAPAPAPAAPPGGGAAAPPPR